MPTSSDLKKKLEAVLDVVNDLESPVVALENWKNVRNLHKSEAPTTNSLKNVEEAFVNGVRSNVEHIRDRVANVRQRGLNKQTLLRSLALSILPIIAIILGCLGWNSCNSNPTLPKLLLCFGFFALGKVVMDLLIETEDNDAKVFKYKCAKGVFSILLLIWFFVCLGHVWARWGTYSGDVSSPYYCDSLTVYGLYIVFFFMLFCLLITAAYYLIVALMHIKDRVKK
ncbi:unnamed protein product, partial [Mesorhabditis spiculigera]